MAPVGTGVHAAVGGRIAFITGLDGKPPSSGYMIVIDGDDGRRYSYIHVGRRSDLEFERSLQGQVSVMLYPNLFLLRLR
jgi:murein DD-endopeptidase MepM/ murein hydrolase activator NlpD